MTRLCIFLPMILIASLCGLGCGQDRAAPSAAASNPLLRAATLHENLEQHVRFLAEIDPPRSHEHPESQARCAEYIAEHFRQAGLAVSFQPFDVNGVTYRNVIGKRGATDAPRLVIGAHYDVCNNLPGADDNASGVAGLIETAYLLKDQPPPTSLEFVAYACEEPPFFATPNMGSHHHAMALKQANTPVTAMICFEMIGYYTDEPDSQRYPFDAFKAVYPSVGNYIGVIGRTADGDLVNRVAGSMKQATDLPVESIAAPQLLQMIGLSDHRSYWKAGYNAMMICDTAFLRNPHYHQPTDTPDTLDYHRMAKAVTATARAIEDLATGEDVK